MARNPTMFVLLFFGKYFYTPFVPLAKGEREGSLVAAMPRYALNEYLLTKDVLYITNTTGLIS